MRTFTFILWWRQPRMYLKRIDGQFHLMRKPTDSSFSRRSTFVIRLQRGEGNQAELLRVLLP